MNTYNFVIDGNEANTPSRVGSNIYAFKILESLFKIISTRTDIAITVVLASEPVVDMPNETLNWSYKVVQPTRFWTQWALPLHLFLHKNTYDVFYTPGHYAPRLCPIPSVSSVMDTAYLEYPDQFKKTDTLKLTEWTKYSVQNAKKVIAISEFTKKCVTTSYKKAPKDVIVAYPGTTTTQFKISATFRKKTLRKFKIKKPYILFVGTLQPRKNIVNLVEAYETFVRLVASRTLPPKGKKPTSKQTPNLVLAGKTGWLADPIEKRITNSPLQKHIIQTGFVTNKEKQVLYEEAFTSTLMGLFEGFGIPPLESLYYGTPVVVSNTTSLPEVVGDAGLLANPLDPNDIAEKMYEVYTATARQKLIWKRRGIAQTKRFSWKTSAQIILETLLSVADETNTN